MAYTSPDLNILIAAAEKASRSLLRDFGEVEQLQVSKKGPADFVSAADRRAEEIIHKELSKARPESGFIMEETGSIKGQKDAPVFIIDPLDGTTNFLHGLPHWCISIGMVENGQPKAGVVYAPVTDELFYAEKGEGAFVGKKRLRVSGRTNLDDCVIAGITPVKSRNSSEKTLKQLDKILDRDVSFRCIGATALDLAYIAAGRLDAMWTMNTCVWDIAAGMLIVEEAKGSVSSLNSTISAPLQSPSILASNGHIHKELEALLGHVDQ